MLPAYDRQARVQYTFQFLIVLRPDCNAFRRSFDDGWLDFVAEQVLMMKHHGNCLIKQNGADKSLEVGVCVEADSDDGDVFVNGTKTGSWGKNNDRTLPSKVLHLRNLPWECTEEELIELGKPFDRVVYKKFNARNDKNQAFNEFDLLDILKVPC